MTAHQNNGLDVHGLSWLSRRECASGSRPKCVGLSDGDNVCLILDIAELHQLFE